MTAVDGARLTTWDQIAAVTGTTAEVARAACHEWADGQHQLYADIGIGLDDAGYAAALKAGIEDGAQP